MGYLDELKRQAEAEKAKLSVDTTALERNTMTTDSACNVAARYFTTLVQQLNVLKPVSPLVFHLDTQTEFRNPRLENFRADPRMKRLRSVEVFDQVVLTFEMNTGRQVTLSKDFPPTIEKLEARLAQCGAPFTSRVVRDAETGRYAETQFDIRGDFRGGIKLVPDHDSGWVEFQVMNLEGFGTTYVSLPAFEVGTARLDDLARWITGGQPGRFLDGAQVRRVES